jgi:phospholipid/cholesterol/gamma-HCH transport system substrate-binding protein
VNLLGEKYVDLRVGDLRRPQPSGTTIPLSRTSAPVELDQVLNILDPDTRAALRILINETGVALAGRGSDFNALLAKLPRSLDQLQSFLGEIDGERATMRDLVSEGDRVVGSLDQRRDGLGRFVSSAEGTLRAVAQRQAQLGRTLTAAPGALHQLRFTLARLAAASRRLTPAADDLHRMASPLRGVLLALPGVAHDAEPAFDVAREVAPSLTRLGRQGLPVVRRLRTTSRDLGEFSDQLGPVSGLLDDNGMRRFLRFADGWGNLTGLSDGLGHIFRVRHTLDKATFEGAISRLVGRVAKQLPSTPQGSRRQLPGIPTIPTIDSKKLPAVLPHLRLPAVPLPRITDAVGGLKRGATSQSSKQGDARRLLDYLLGS